MSSGPTYPPGPVPVYYPPPLMVPHQPVAPPQPWADLTSGSSSQKQKCCPYPTIFYVAAWCITISFFLGDTLWYAKRWPGFKSR